MMDQLLCRTPGCGRRVWSRGYLCPKCREQPSCATCGVKLGPLDGGYFCSLTCNWTERVSRVVHRLVDGLRRLAA